MASTKITVNDNGSLRIEGDFEIVDKTGARYDLGRKGNRSLFAVADFPKINHSVTDPIKIILSTMLLLLRCHRKKQ